MNKKIAELKITDKWTDKELTEAVEKAGYILTLEYDGISEKYYIISKPVVKEG